MKTPHILLALVPAVLLTSCYVTPAGGPYAGPPGPPPGRVRVDHDHRHYDRRDRHHDLAHDRDRGRPGYSYADARDPRSPGGRVILPREARRINYRGQVYYTHRNVWYRPSGSTYVIVRSPY